MRPVHFVVDESPVAWQRARLARGGRHHFTAAETRQWKDTVARLGKVAMLGREPLRGPVELLVVFLLPVPAGWPAWKRKEALCGRLVPTTRPDWDNLGKGVSDALNGIAWADDAQVVDCFTRKRYAAAPCAVVHVKPLDLLPAQVLRRPSV